MKKKKKNKIKTCGSGEKHTMCSWENPAMCSWEKPAMCFWEKPTMCFWEKPTTCFLEKTHFFVMMPISAYTLLSWICFFKNGCQHGRYIKNGRWSKLYFPYFDKIFCVQYYLDIGSEVMNWYFKNGRYIQNGCWKNVVFCISTGLFFLQHLLDIGSNLVKFFQQGHQIQNGRWPKYGLLYFYRAFWT